MHVMQKVGCSVEQGIRFLEINGFASLIITHSQYTKYTLAQQQMLSQNKLLKKV